MFDNVKFNSKPNEEPKKHAHVAASSNLRKGQEFLKKLFFPKENFYWDIGGSIDNRLIWICWTPPIGVKAGNVKYPISTHQSEQSFMDELDDAYRVTWGIAKKYYDSIEPKQQYFGYAVNE